MSTSTIVQVAVSRAKPAVRCIQQFQLNIRRTMQTVKNEEIIVNTRESAMHKLKHHHLPNKIDKYLLVWTGQYKKTEDVPLNLPLQRIKRAREKGRIVVATLITLSFLVSVPFMMRSGRRQRDRGDTVWKQHKELQHKLHTGEIKAGTTWNLWG